LYDLYPNVLQIEGCVPFQFSSSELMLSSSDFSIWDTKLAINASVEEEGTGLILCHLFTFVLSFCNTTGVVLEEYSEGPQVEQTLLNFDTSESPDYFKPGLPYYGKVCPLLFSM
jgi:hypothetical protein